jgi:hypothetical protein
VAFYPPFFFSLGRFARFVFNRVFERFVTRGGQIRDKKIAFAFRSRQKKYLLTCVVLVFTPPLAQGSAWRSPGHQSSQ